MIYRLLSKCILPKEWRGLELGGQECGVVLLDTDLKFNLQRVLVLLQATLAQCVAVTCDTCPLTSARALTAHEAPCSAEEIDRELELVCDTCHSRTSD